VTLCSLVDFMTVNVTKSLTLLLRCRPKNGCSYVRNLQCPSPALKKETSGSSEMIPNDTATHPRRLQCLYTPPCKPQISQISLHDTVNDMTTRFSPHILVPVISHQQCGAINLPNHNLSLSPYSIPCALSFFQQ
jgi:hypothetical protein